MRLANRANSAALDEFDDLPVIFGGMDLNAHLRSDFDFGSSFADATGFPDVVRKGFLAIDMFAVLQREHGGEGVGMFAGADDDGIEIARLLKDFAEVAEFFGVGMFIG